MINTKSLIRYDSPKRDRGIECQNVGKANAHQQQKHKRRNANGKKGLELWILKHEQISGEHLQIRIYSMDVAHLVGKKIRSETEIACQILNEMFCQHTNKVDHIPVVLRNNA